jgi:hypothetical protein
MGRPWLDDILNPRMLKYGMGIWYRNTNFAVGYVAPAALSQFDLEQSEH